MTRFEELQQIWQSQPQDAPRLDIRGATDVLRRFGRRQHIINACKAAFIAAQAWICLAKLGITAGTVVGEAILLAGVARLLFNDWRSQMEIARLDFSRPSVAFVQAAIERMADPNAGYRRQLGANMALVCVGYNWLALSVPSAHSLAQRLAMQIGVTALMVIAVLTIGLWLHAKRCELEYRPIRERLLAMKDALEQQQ